MKLKFKHQKLQAEASKAVCDVFSGQPCFDENLYLIDRVTYKAKKIYMTLQVSRTIC